MPEDSKAESTVANQPVSLPPRGFEMDELQAKLETAAATLRPDADQAEIDAVMQAAVRDALPEGQPSLDTDPSALEGYKRVVVQDDADGELRTTQVYISGDETPAQLRAIAAAAPEAERVITETGKTRTARTALAEQSSGDQAAAQ